MRMHMSRHTLGKNMQGFSTSDIKPQVSPDRMYFMFVPEDYLEGKEGQNPFLYSSSIRSDPSKTEARKIARVQSVNFKINDVRRV